MMQTENQESLGETMIHLILDLLMDVSFSVVFSLFWVFTKEMQACNVYLYSIYSKSVYCRLQYVSIWCMFIFIINIYIYTCILYVQHPCYCPWILWHGVAFAFTAAPFGGDLYDTWKKTGETVLRFAYLMYINFYFNIYKYPSPYFSTFDRWDAILSTK